MPGFGASLTDAQVAALAAYVRARFADGPAWTDIDAAVREARKTGGGT
jgi:nicotinate dehydrogenase subunit B